MFVLEKAISLQKSVVFCLLGGEGLSLQIICAYQAMKEEVLKCRIIVMKNRIVDF